MSGARSIIRADDELGGVCYETPVVVSRCEVSQESLTLSVSH